MVGGYVMISVPAILGEASFESGTVFPGLHDKLEKAMATGKVLLCQFDGPLSSGTVVAPFVAAFTKMTNGDLIINSLGKTYVVNSSDIVTTD